MSDYLDQIVCGCGAEDCDCQTTEPEDGLSKAEKTLLVYKALVKTAEAIGQNLPKAESRINTEQARGGETVTLSVTIN